MTKAELLMPRFKVVGDYPGSTEAVGSIKTYPHGIIHPMNVWADWHDTYPAIYRRVEWWDQRSAEELPDYVRNLVTGEIQKVEWLIDGKRLRVVGEGHYIAIHVGYLPATLDEFNAFTTKQQQP